MTLQSRSTYRQGFTLIEILVVLGIIALVSALAIPNLFKSRDTAQKTACIENLNRIEGVKQQWGAEKKKDQADVAEIADLEPYLKKFPSCPSGGAYVLQPLGTKATCNIPGHTL